MGPPAHPRLELQLDGKLAVGFGIAGATPSTAVPLALLGVRYGRLAAQLGFGFQRTTTSTMEAADAGPGTGVASVASQTTVTTFLCAPTLTLDLYRSADGRAALYLLGAALLGGYLQDFSQTSSNAGATDQSGSNLAYGYQFAIGGRAALSDHFWLGIEAGPIGLYYGANPDVLVLPPGEATTVLASGHGSTVLYAALVGTFRLGR